MKPIHAVSLLLLAGLLTNACAQEVKRGPAAGAGSTANQGPTYTAPKVKIPPKGAPLPPAPPPAPPSPPTASPAGPPDNSLAIRQQIVDGVPAHFPEIRKCYDDVTGAAAANGSVVVRFLVAPSGDVVQAADEGSTMQDKSVVSCIVNVFGRMKFPTFEGSAVPVVYPIEFTMSGG